MTRRIRPSLALAIAAALGACTFPDVDYADGGDTATSSSSGSTSSSSGSSSSGTGGTCMAPSSCADIATGCAKDASNKHTSCTASCKPTKPSCPSVCDQTYGADLTTCTAVCASCSMVSCDGGPTNCASLVGL